jgi:hypothetical protein
VLIEELQLITPVIVAVVYGIMNGLPKMSTPSTFWWAQFDHPKLCFDRISKKM